MTKQAVALMSAGAIGQMTVMQAVSADETTQVTAGSFDLTKQADKATFPVMFDRPSGVNAAALAGTVINLGTDSKLYQSAVKAVPELADQIKWLIFCLIHLVQMRQLKLKHAQQL